MARFIDRDGLSGYKAEEREMAAASLPNIQIAADRETRRGNAGLSEYIGIAFDSLRSNKLRSFLTLLGIIIGITSIILVISIIEGLNRYWKEKVSNFGPNTFVINQFPIVTNPDEYFKMLKRNPEIKNKEAEAVAGYC